MTGHHFPSHSPGSQQGFFLLSLHLKRLEFLFYDLSNKTTAHQKLYLIKHYINHKSQLLFKYKVKILSLYVLHERLHIYVCVCVYDLR